MVGNTILIVALGIVCLLLGFREGRRWGYGEGHADGIFAGEKGIFKYLTESEVQRVKDTQKKEAREFYRKYIKKE